MSSEIIVDVVKAQDLAAAIEVMGEASSVVVVAPERMVVEIEEKLVVELAPAADQAIVVEAVDNPSTVVITDPAPPAVVEVTIPGPAGPGVPEGGSPGQVLRKGSEADYDSEWGDQVLVGTGDPPDPAGVPDGTLFVKIL